jgi:hypothetical protein
MGFQHAGQDGWFDFEGFYNHVVNKFKDGGKFVEIGCWFGKSSCGLLRKIKEIQANITVDFIDTWAGEPNVEYQKNIIKDNGDDYVYNCFLHNIKEADPEFNGKIHRLESQQAVSLYEDESLDFVFIDDDHSYENIVKEIPLWLAKVKKGGILAGHDYDFGDVKRAVHELLGELPEQQGHVWCYQK